MLQSDLTSPTASLPTPPTSDSAVFAAQLTGVLVCAG
jgi:hypothetical protein